MSSDELRAATLRCALTGGSDVAKLRAAGGPEKFIQLVQAVEVNDGEKVSLFMM